MAAFKDRVGAGRTIELVGGLRANGTVSPQSVSVYIYVPFMGATNTEVLEFKLAAPSKIPLFLHVKKYIREVGAKGKDIDERAAEGGCHSSIWGN